MRSQIVSTDPIADMLTRIRNAIMVNKHEITLPHSKVKESVALILKDSGFIADVKSETEDSRKLLKLTISNEGEPARITGLDRMSKPGRRYYVGNTDIPTVLRGRGIVIISTSKGMMTGVEAKKQGLGGELMCKVY